MPEPGHASLHGTPVLNAQHCNTLIKWLKGKITNNIGEFLEQNDPQNIVDQVQDALFPAKAARAHHKKANAPVTPEGVSSRVYKRRCYARLQRNYKSDSSKTAREVLDDTWRGSSSKVTLEECLPFWRELFERESPEARECPPPQAMHEELWSDITTSEITSSLKGVSGAAGPDRLSWREVKNIAPGRIAA